MKLLINISNRGWTIVLPPKRTVMEQNNPTEMENYTKYDYPMANIY